MLLLNIVKYYVFIRILLSLSMLKIVFKKSISIRHLHWGCMICFLLTVDSEEHRNLVHGLVLLKDTISNVNTHVDEFEKAARLRDLSSKLEPKSQVKTTHGRVFRREDMLQGERRLLHEGVLNWRLTSNKSKGDHCTSNRSIMTGLNRNELKHYSLICIFIFYFPLTRVLML